MKTEQRKYRRYRMKEDEFILFHDGNVGRMCDLSIGGCSCKCMLTENTLKKPTNLSILYSDNRGRLTIESVPFTIVHGCLNNILPFTSTRMRKCGIKFGDISSSQKKQIELLISQYGET